MYSMLDIMCLSESMRFINSAISSSCFSVIFFMFWLSGSFFFSREKKKETKMIEIMEIVILIALAMTLISYLDDIVSRSLANLQVSSREIGEDSEDG